jgi:hypothetical protein
MLSLSVMPRCEGLPDGPCPHNVNNRSVKLTQGDLMLCPKCDAVRFPPAQLSSCPEPANTNDNTSTRKTSSSSSVTATNVKSKSKQLQLQPADPTLATTGADANIDCINATVPLPTAVLDIAEFHHLQLLVQQQQCTIQKLQNQLNFILSFLGIDDDDSQVYSDQCNNEPDPSSSSSSSSSSSNSSNYHHNTPVDDTDSSNVPNAQPSWSTVVRRKRPASQSNSFQRSVVAAVYVDQTMKKRRETSLIVSGLKPAVDITDSALFTSLCHDELDTDPDIVKTMRLGKNSPVEGKARLLLVILREADQVRRLLASARKLRHSTNPAVREAVYINPNLTKAEAVAAYQLRVKKRAAAQQRASRTTTKQQSSLLPTIVQDLGLRLPAAPSVQPATAISSTLNPLAGTFLPDVPQLVSSD